MLVPSPSLESAMAFIAYAVYGVLPWALAAMASEPMRCLGVPSFSSFDVRAGDSFEFRCRSSEASLSYCAPFAIS
jgi:hypothetical protein